MKKIKMFHVTAAVIMMTVLVGCGGKTETSSDLTTITMWSNDSHSKNFMEEKVKEFNETIGKEQNVCFDYEVKEGDSFTKSLQLALQTGQAPDLLNGGSLKERVGEGYIVPLDEMPGGAELIAKYEGKFMEGTHTYKGKTYSLPTSVTTRGLIYNKDMFKAAGIVDENGEAKPPATFEEMREDAKKLTDNSSNRFGIIFPLKWSGWVGSDITDFLLNNAGHYGFDPVSGTYDYSAVIPVINTYLGMIEDGSVYPGMQGIDNDTARAYFANGMVGMKLGYSFDVNVLNEQFPAQCDWGVAPLPFTDANGQKYKQFLSYGSSNQINANSVKEKDPEAIMTVYKWLISDDFKIEQYKAGVTIPENWDLVKDLDATNMPKGWSDFASMVEFSHRRNIMPETDMNGMLTWAERINEEVFGGKISAEDMIEQYNKDITDGTEKYYAAHTDESFDDYLDSDWDIKR